MCLTEYDEARTMELLREEYREEGLAEGRAEGRKEGRAEGKDEALTVSIRNLMNKLKMTAEKAMEILDIPPEEHEKYALMLKEKDSTQTYDTQS